MQLISGLLNFSLLLKNTKRTKTFVLWEDYSAINKTKNEHVYVSNIIKPYLLNKINETFIYLVLLGCGPFQDPSTSNRRIYTRATRQPQS